MSIPEKLLPTELAALIHHVELNRAGWWDKAVHRLVLAAVWLTDKPPTVLEIQTILKREFRLSLNEGRVSAATQALESQNMLVRLNDSSFRIPTAKRTIFEAEIAEAEAVTNKAKAYFTALVEELCDGLQADSAWQVFESEFLAPLIKEVGANAYHLIAGEGMAVDQKLVRRFLKRFDENHHPALNELVPRFLDPKKDDVRTYVSRLLHASFCVEASGLPENVIQKLNSSSGKQVSFRVFVDTNFLFSILALHENPSNAAASELRDLLATLNGNPKVTLFVTPRTIDEAKHSISLTKGQLAGVPMGGNFTSAAIRVGFSGMAERFLEERLRCGGRLSVDDWFNPYLNNFVSVARGMGVELYNVKLDHYAKRQDVVDDIHLVMDAQKRRNLRPKTYEMIQHDMILWHLVADSRPAYIESAIDAKDWILTVDFRLIGFDEQKQKLNEATAKVPICLHPTSFIQLLQFWVPRTAEFEQAIIGSLRLPFLFQEFDAEAERTSLRILKGIGRFENNEQLSEETIADVVLNEGLRARIKNEKNEEAEVTLIRDALVEEMKARAHAEESRTQELAEALKHRDSKLSALGAETKSKDDAIEHLKSRVTEEANKAQQAKEKLKQQGSEIEALKAKWQEQERTQKRRRALLGYFAIFVLLVGSATVIAWFFTGLLPQLVSLIGSNFAHVLIGVVVFILLHLILEWLVGRRNSMKNLWPFQQVSRFRRWLWSVVIIGLLLSVFSGLKTNQIQQNLDGQKAISPSAAAAPSLKQP